MMTMREAVPFFVMMMVAPRDSRARFLDIVRRVRRSPIGLIWGRSGLHDHMYLPAKFVLYYSKICSLAQGRSVMKIANQLRRTSRIAGCGRV